MTSSSLSSSSSQFSYSSFLAADTPVRIVPLFTLSAEDQVDFLTIPSGSLGSFTAGLDMDVPMWLALFLQQRHLCRILLPPWLTVSNLKHVLQQEKTQGTFCHQIPTPAATHDDDDDEEEDDDDGTNVNSHNDKPASRHRGLPLRYLEIAQALLLNNKITAATMSSSTSDVLGGGSGGGDSSDRNVEAMRILLQDICQVRLDKIRTNLHTISQNTASNFQPHSTTTTSSWNGDDDTDGNPSNKQQTMPLVNVSGIASVEVAYYQPMIQQLFRDHDTLCQMNSTAANVMNNADHNGVVEGPLEKENAFARRAGKGINGDDDDGIESNPVLRSRLLRRRLR